MPWPARRAGSTRCGSLPSSSTPERVRQPARGVDGDDGDARALGREAHGQGGRRRRLAHAARARADDDALAGQARSHSQRSSSRARRASRAAPSSKANGSVATGARAPRRRRRSCAALGPGAGVGVARRADLRAVGRRLERARVGGGEALGEHAVAHDQVDLEADVVAQRVLQGERLVDRHLLGPGHRDDARPFRVGDHRVDRTALAGDAAHAGGLREGPRRAQHGDAVAGRGRVEDDEVVGLGARRAAVVLRQLPHLADRQQLAHARRRGREVAERAARARAARPAPPAAGRRGRAPSRARGRSTGGAGRARAPPRACPRRPGRARRRRGARPRRRSCAARGRRRRARAQRPPSSCRPRPCP